MQTDIFERIFRFTFYCFSFFNDLVTTLEVLTMAKSILVIAKGLYDIYNDVFNAKMDEMKMHKLLYFAQKEHYKTFGEWLFEEHQEGWVHGPVNKEVRDSFLFFSANSNYELTLEEEYTIRQVIHEYGIESSWELRNRSHKDQAYKRTRVGLSESEPGNQIISKEDMITDINLSLTFDDCEVLN